MNFQSSWEGKKNLKNKMRGADRKCCGNSEKGVASPIGDNKGVLPTGRGRSWGKPWCARWRARERSNATDTGKSKTQPRETNPLREELGNFPGGPVAKIPRSQCRGPGFDARSGN